MIRELGFIEKIYKFIYVITKGDYTKICINIKI